jgi:hypothetical protein
MCLFTGVVNSVSNTRIFAAPVGSQLQLIVYQNEVSVSQNVAMVLPFPFYADQMEQKMEIQLINMTQYTDFFKDCDKELPKSSSPRGTGIFFGGGFGSAASNNLEIKQVGSYDISVAYSLDQLGKLNWEHFDLSRSLLAILQKNYAESFGFLVCKIQASKFASARPLFGSGGFGSFGPSTSSFGTPSGFQPTRPTSSDFEPVAFVCPMKRKVEGNDLQLFVPTRHEHGKGSQQADWDHQIWIFHATSSKVGNVDLPISNKTTGTGKYISWGKVGVTPLNNLSGTFARFDLGFQFANFNEDLIFDTGLERVPRSSSEKVTAVSEEAPPVSFEDLLMFPKSELELQQIIHQSHVLSGSTIFYFKHHAEVNLASNEAVIYPALAKEKFNIIVTRQGDLMTVKLVPVTSFSLIHPLTICDECHQPLDNNARYHCKQCANKDYCSKCINSLPDTNPCSNHVTMRIKNSRELAESPYLTNRCFWIHEGTFCAHCTKTPIIGFLYHCTLCQVDICEECDFLGKHSIDHSVLRIAIPKTVPN